MDILQKDRLAREKKTIAAMMEIYCRGRHRRAGGNCPECRQLRDYALQRIEKCPYGEEKPVCARCPIHCYQPAMREQVRRVMRYAGPRMLFYHPLLTLRHCLDGLAKAGPPGALEKPKNRRSMKL
ncbi:MAG: nitrous oxide-stimulated promoter family protein [Deltaproteobacteria bacterium]|nr:nitrous oxide-stimulated promoter family protein [Deltaproteobacteria bacterium]